MWGARVGGVKWVFPKKKMVGWEKWGINNHKAS